MYSAERREQKEQEKEKKCRRTHTHTPHLVELFFREAKKASEAIANLRKR